MTIIKTTCNNMFTFRVHLLGVPRWDFLEALREHPGVAYAIAGLGGHDDYDISLGVHTEEIGLGLLATVIEEAKIEAEKKWAKRGRAIKRRIAQQKLNREKETK